MRVLLAIATMEAGGAERQLAYIASGLVAAGHDVHVVLMRRGPNYDRLVRSGATVHEISRVRVRLLAPVVRLFWRVRPDIVYAWLRPFDVIGGLAARALRLPCVHAERTAPNEAPATSHVIIRRTVVRLSDGVIANSDAGSSYWRGHLPSTIPVLHIRNIVPTDELAAVVASEESRGTLVVVGRLDHGKNVMTLLRVILRLHQEGLSCPLLLVGDGPLFGELLGFIRHHNLQHLVTMAGHRSDVWPLMKGSRAVVSLSRFEGSPNAVLEAAGMGCRLILSDIPAHHGISPRAHLVDPNSDQQVAGAVRALFLGGSNFLSGENGVESSTDGVRNEAAVNEVVAQHLSFFSRTIERRRGHRAVGI